jgi:hypothetical protein
VDGLLFSTSDFARSFFTTNAVRPLVEAAPATINAAAVMHAGHIDLLLSP